VTDPSAPTGDAGRSGAQPGGPTAPGGRNPAGSGPRVDPDRQRVVGIVVIGLAVLLGLVFLFRGLGPEDDLVIPGGDSPETTVTTSDRNTPPPTDLTTTTLPAPPPAEVTILVANGSGVDGVGASTTEALGGRGYQTLNPTNTPATPSSQVLYVPGAQASAEQVAATLGLPPTAVAPLGTTPPVEDLGTAQVLVIIGSNFPGLQPE
jgi:hypothetical protein